MAIREPFFWLCSLYTRNYIITEKWCSDAEWEDEARGQVLVSADCGWHSWGKWQLHRIQPQLTCQNACVLIKTCNQKKESRIAFEIVSVIPMWVASDSGGMDQWSETKCNYPITTEKCNGVMCNCSPPIFHLLTASVGGCQTVTWSNGDISKMRIVQLRLVILYNILQYHPPSLYLICIVLYTASMLSFCLIIH